jgi:hypothetical protein
MRKPDSDSSESNSGPHEAPPAEESHAGGVPANGSTVHGSNAVTYSHCAAVLTRNTWGFALGQLKNWGGINRGKCIDCVACMAQGPSTHGGFYWPAEANLKPNVWVFQDCVSHNNAALGVYAWENDPQQRHEPGQIRFLECDRRRCPADQRSLQRHEGDPANGEQAEQPLPYRSRRRHVGLGEHECRARPLAFQRGAVPDHGRPRRNAA